MRGDGGGRKPHSSQPHPGSPWAGTAAAQGKDDGRTYWDRNLPGKHTGRLLFYSRLSRGCAESLPAGLLSSPRLPGLATASPGHLLDPQRNRGQRRLRTSKDWWSPAAQAAAAQARKWRSRWQGCQSCNGTSGGGWADGWQATIAVYAGDTQRPTNKS